MKINITLKIQVVTLILNVSYSNPGIDKFSISLWLRVSSPQSATQTVFQTGSTSWDTGVLLQVTDSAKTISGQLITGRKHLYSQHNVHDTLSTWTHIAMNFNNPGIY